ncbi:T. brucei spp.-specific protein [Trypanosoma brucei gambiense DAL972]|uniref:T. brucei spp.-specific protein n=1 Tax=Trypanosoma brucei gambiense (strain MHOM/CI/86/DAL972) TaxID=679716 RepID=D0A3E2_TRYB9|nr:T. brucei spp.-specific protein [Trypanosoma brucei gambiense DAL972]CBH15786.1 T. brucei spp.-specific protein [Trypanosoma brucei gambiense DAL972]|eukprot:XP_011778050.1 T. brucei spp.-specific protein [Trypanosoma brucei gambiense DAL972]
MAVQLPRQYWWGRGDAMRLLFHFQTWCTTLARKPGSALPKLGTACSTQRLVIIGTGVNWCGEVLSPLTRPHRAVECGVKWHFDGEMGLPNVRSRNKIIRTEIIPLGCSSARGMQRTLMDLETDNGQPAAGRLQRMDRSVRQQNLLVPLRA